MRLLFTLLAFSFLLSALPAQNTKEATVPVTASITLNPASVTLNFVNPGNANLQVYRRTKGQGGTTWQLLLNASASNQTSLTDNNVTAGQIYEYEVQRTLNGIVALGYAHVAVNANPVNSRGKILIFVDSTTADALGVELVRLKNDMRGDGWWPIPFHTGPHSTVQSIKAQIVESYNADPTNVKAVLLLGTVPVPYSGNTAWDGHVPDHQGAWPADSYYADVNGNWTDVAINNTVPNRDANDNIPGDGKFDQSYIPSFAELQVGRVDFHRLNAPAFGAADHVGLMKRYLDKNHQWRIGNYVVENKALVDDNFGYFGGEAFASNGYRNAYPLVGEANIVEADFFLDTNPQSYLLGYGTGGGSYQSAGGVGSSADFAVDSVNIVFSNIFGSYHGDWDYEVDPFMPSALASRGGILTCSWAGRPHWSNHALASGETIGYCTKETMNAQSNTHSIGSSYGESGAHVSLLGDPTLRANVVKPATNLSLSVQNCQQVELNWTASADSVAGYLIYRALSQDGPYTRLSNELVTATNYSDETPIADTLFYQVRAIKYVSTPGGGTYANNAIGPIKFIVFAPPQADASVSGELNCNTTTVQLQSGNNTPNATYTWTPATGLSCTDCPNPVASLPGNYSVVVTVGVCTATDAVEVKKAADLVIDLGNSIVNCEGNANLCVNITGGTPPYTYAWSNGSTEACALYTAPANIFLSITDHAGCVITSDFVLIAPAPIVLSLNPINETAPGANDGAVDLTSLGGAPPYTYLWSNGATTQDIVGLPGGVYTVMVTDANGCTETASVTVNTTSDTQEAAYFENFQLSPNPTQGLALLELKLRQLAELRVELRDIAGRLVWEKNLGQTENVHLPIDLSQSPAGMYSISVWVGNQIFVRKLTLQR